MSYEAKVSEVYATLSDYIDCWDWYKDPELSENVINRIPKAPSNILDLCCGPGILLERLAQRYPDREVVGSDLSDTMVSKARNRTCGLENVSVYQGDWIEGFTNEIAGRAKTFDVIIVKNALHLLCELDFKIMSLHEVMHPSSVVIIVETVSPSVVVNSFVRGLFRELRLETCKRHYFTKRGLIRGLHELVSMRR